MIGGFRHARLALATSCAWLAVATSAQAQDTVPGRPAPAPDQAATGAQTDRPATSNEDIVVTGSRVIANGNNSPTPVTVVSTAQLAVTTPSNIADGLNKLPDFQNSQTVASPGGANTNPSGNFLNLRSIGAIRTLILFDGHRVPSTSQDGTVDVNTLPQSLVKRVDVVTGGASAVYGSDAITGVVNFIVDRDFTGIKAYGQGGVTERGDDGTERAGIAAGTKLFGGKGHVEVSYDYFRSDGLPSKLDRDFGSRAYIQTGAGTAANPFAVASDARFPVFSAGGVIITGPNAGQNFTANGVATPFQPGAPLPGGLQQGGSGNFFTKGRLVSALETHQAFGRFDYDLTDHIRFYAQGGYAHSVDGGDVVNFLYPVVSIAANNPFLPAALQQPTGSFLFGKSSDVLPPQGIEAYTRNIYINTGLAGSIAPGVDFDLSYTHGNTRQDLVNTGNVANGRFFAALDAVRDPATGAIVCNVSLTNPGLYPGCVPINPFGPSSESQAAIAYQIIDTTITNRNVMDDVAFNVAATPFSTWAGPVRVALSGEYRRMSLGVSSQYQQSVPLDCTGLRFNCIPGGTARLQGTETNNVYASQNVKEAALEVNVPLLRDSAIARSLDVNGAVRYADYSTSGQAWTWKVGLNWHPTDSLTIRATRSRDFRAPTLYDLFATPNAHPINFTDIHTGITAQSVNQSQGNPNLKPEVSNTVTGGIVYQVPFVRGLSLAVDYYRIEIKNAIASIGDDPQTQAQCEASNGTSPLCQLFVRPLPFSNRTAANFPTLVLNENLNVSSLRSQGIDAEANYQTALAGGMLSLRALMTYQPDLTTQRFAGTAPINAAGGPNQSIWRATAFLSYDNGPILVAAQERWRSSQRPETDRTLVANIGRIPSVAYTDLTLTARVGERRKFEFFLSIQNLFDKDPPLYVGNTLSTPGFFYPTVSGDDVLGRTFTAGFRIRLP